MRPVSAQTTIDAPREQVYALLMDMSARPGFTDHFLSGFRLQRIEPVGVGASARFRLGESGAWLDSSIESAEHPHRIIESGRGGRENRIPTHTAWELANAPGGGCEVRVTFWTEPKALADRLREPFSPRALRRGWRRALERLKDMAETGERPQHVVVGGGSRIPY